MSHHCPEPWLAAIMELFHHGDELPWAAVIVQDPPHTFTTYSVEGLGQVEVGGEHVGILYLTFLLKLLCSEHHVYGPVLFPESTLALW